MITIDDLKAIEETIETAKKNNARAEGAQARLLHQLEEEFGISDASDIDEKARELREAVEKDERKLEKFLAKLDALADWDSI